MERMPSELQTPSAPPQLRLTSKWRCRKRGPCGTRYVRAPAAIIFKKRVPFVKQQIRVCAKVICCVPSQRVAGSLSAADAEWASHSPNPDWPVLPTPSHWLAVNRTMSIRRGGQRWSSLISAPTSRIATVMIPALGDKWPSFLSYATERFKKIFISAFDPPSGLLSCVGMCNGAECKNQCVVDLASPQAGEKLKNLHLDHEQDLQVTLDMWKEALPPQPASWRDGIDGDLLCHLLLGVKGDPVFGPAMLRFRCGPSQLGSGKGYCHQLNMPHYRRLCKVAV